MRRGHSIASGYRLLSVGALIVFASSSAFLLPPPPIHGPKGHHQGKWLRMSALPIVPFVPPSTVPAVAWDVGVAVAMGAASVAWTNGWAAFTGEGKPLSPVLTRKVIHSTSGPLLLLVWPFFSGKPFSRLVAAAIPLMQALRLTLSGLGKGEVSLANAVSRSGNKSEAVGGPLLYCLIICMATLLEWRASLIGICVVSQLAAGDGMADIIGRRFGRRKWWFSSEKSYAGTLGFAVAAWLTTTLLVAWFYK
jgi:dolichol kinase